MIQLAIEHVVYDGVEDGVDDGALPTIDTSPHSLQHVF